MNDTWKKTRQELQKGSKCQFPLHFIELKVFRVGKHQFENLRRI